MILANVHFVIRCKITRKLSCIPESLLGLLSLPQALLDPERHQPRIPARCRGDECLGKQISIWVASSAYLLLSLATSI